MKGLTPKSADLCATCVNAFIREGQSGNRTTICTWVHPQMLVYDKTYECQDYRHKSQPDQHDLEKIAWIITSDPKGKVGFRPWKDMSTEEREQQGLRHR